MEENSNKKGFNKGFLMAIVGWFFTFITIPVITALIQEIKQGTLDLSRLFEYPAEILTFSFLYGIVMLIIWGPAAVIISKAYRKKGFNKALLLTVAVYVISMLIYFGCTGTYN